MNRRGFLAALGAAAVAPAIVRVGNLMPIRVPRLVQLELQIIEPSWDPDWDRQKTAAEIIEDIQRGCAALGIPAELILGPRLLVTLPPVLPQTVVVI